MEPAGPAHLGGQSGRQPVSPSVSHLGQSSTKYEDGAGAGMGVMLAVAVAVARAAVRHTAC